MKFPFLKSKQVKPLSYLGIFLTSTEGVVFLMQCENDEMHIIDSEDFSYTHGWDQIEEDIDNALSLIEAKGSSLPDETIFFVYSHFIDKHSDHIKKEFLDKIKKASKSLELKPLGFIECFEAVSDYIEKHDERPLTSILVESDESNLGVFIYKAGKKIHEEVVARTGQVAQDLLTIFAQMPIGVLLPTRIILYGIHDLGPLHHSLGMFKWPEEYFIQIPKVEIVPKKHLIDALSKVFEKQILHRQDILPIGESAQQEQVHVEVDDNSLEGVEQSQDESAEDKPDNIMGFTVGVEHFSVSESTTTNNTYRSEERPEKVLKKSMFRLPKLQIKFPHIHIPMQNLLKGKVSHVMIPLIGVLLIAAGLYVNEYYFHTATINVFLPTQQIVKTLSADVTVGDSTAPITVSVSTNSASFSDSKTVSGTKEVGDKAKGPVTLNNFDDKEKVFAKGTVIQSAGLSFVLDSDVKVASASVSTDGSTPGKGKGTVTASVIGTESNLAKGQRFRIDDLSSTVYYAINDEAFSGGTKKTVHIVSKKDADDLKSSVLQKAKNGSSSQGNAEEHAGSHLLETLTQTDISEPIFSKQIGDQADTVSIQSKVVTSSYYVSDSQVKSYIQESLKGAIQNGFVLRDDQITYTLKNVTKKKDTVHMDIDTMARAGKDIDKNALIANITMKGKAQVERLLKTTYAVQSYNVKFTHAIPFIPEYFPLFKKNIQLQISYQ